MVGIIGKLLPLLLVVIIFTISTVGLAGEGPSWVRYFGSGTVILLLFIIVGNTGNMSATSKNKNKSVKNKTDDSDDSTIDVVEVDNSKDSELHHWSN